MKLANKEIEEYTYPELIDYCTGFAILTLGRGESIRTVITDTINMATHWREAVRNKKAESKKKAG